MALVIVLSIAAIVGLLAGVLASDTAILMHQAGSSRGGSTAEYVAKGALQRALLELDNDPDWTGTSDQQFPGDPDKTFTLQLYTNSASALEPLSTPAGVELPPGSSLVLATGQAGNEAKRVAGLLVAESEGGAGFAGLSQRHVAMNGGTVNAFSAPQGDFSMEALEFDSTAGQIGSISSYVNLKQREMPNDPDTIVYAKVEGAIAAADLDGDPTTPDDNAYQLEAGTSIGDEVKLDAPPEIDPPTPGITYLGGVDEACDNGEHIVTPGHYNSLHFSGDVEVTLEAGDYYIKENFEAWGDAVIRTNGPVKMYVDGLLHIAGDAAVNFEGNPADYELELTGDRPSYQWLPHSANWLSSSPYSPGGVAHHGSTSHHGKIWGRVRAPESRFVVSGYIFGDLQADGISFYGDPDGSGVLSFFKEFAEGGESAASENYSYSEVWVVD